ncbi:MAG: hypothetical protein RBU21_08365 [FCB group bacterium]|jgi:hypothetical protein|nr:hypothetical protein [FCB group bacterium]
MTTNNPHSGAVSLKLLLIAGGLLFVVAMVALGLMNRSEPEPAPTPPVAAPQPEPEPDRMPAATRPAVAQTPQTPSPEAAAHREDVFLEMLQQYQEHVAALDDQANIYRNSMPVFTNFKEAFRAHVLPFMLRGETARQDLAKMQPEGFNEQQQEVWQAEQAPYAHATLAPYLADIGAEVYEFAMSAKTPVPVANAENLGQWVSSLQQVAGIEGDDWRRNPFEPGTIDHTRFEAYLGESAGLFAAAMAQVLLPVPPELEAQQEELEAERQALIDAAPPDQTAGLPEEYVEPFTREMAAAFGQFTNIQQPAPEPELEPEPDEF